MSMVLVTKAIKPSKIKTDAFRLEMLSAMNQIASGITKDFKETTKTWKHKPRFETLRSTTGGAVSVLVATDDTIYGYVNKGTPPHDITAKTSKGLMFKWAGAPNLYLAKTEPGVIGSRQSEAFADTFTNPMVVKHPGIEARGFNTAIAEKWQPRFTKRMQLAMKVAAQKSGHAL